MGFGTTLGWSEKTLDNTTILQAGTLNNAKKIIQASSNILEIENILKDESLSFGLIIDTPDYTLAIGDRVQGYTIYYSQKTGEVFTNPQDIENLDEQSALEMATAGYVLGNGTLDQDTKQLQAGELVFIDKTTKTPTIKTHRHYCYKPKPIISEKTEEQWKTELGTVVNSIMQRAIASCGDRPICVPLSGGLDSRLILAKLHEHGVKNLYTFSYGMKGNFEAEMAKKVAGMLGVKWFMVPSNPKSLRTLYKSSERKAYETDAHGLSRVPSYVEFEALKDLKEKELIPEDTIIINGQSGDYITGGHIPACLFENDNPSEDDMYRYILDKHFSLWKNLKTPEIEAKIKAHIAELLLPNDPELSAKDNLIRQYESFEWQERQCKMVVNGQKAYDFFGYDWRLPLWDKELMDFYENMPWHLKYKQNLFKSYLKEYNYKGVFEFGSAEPKVWKPSQYWILCAGRMIGLLKSKDAKDDFYKKMYYYGDQYCQYALFDKTLFDSHYKDLRNMMSLAVLDYMKAHNILLPDFD